MSIFGSIMDKIFHHANAAAPASTASSAPAATASPPSAAPIPSQTAMPATATQGQQRLNNVDVDAVLTQLASTKCGGGNWRTSIVDLLKLLDMDSSLSARKSLADEINIHAGADGSAEQNIALQKAVMQKIADNGGKVPDSLRR